MESAISSFTSGGLSSMFSGMSSSSGTALQGGATALSMLSEITAGRVARQDGNVAASMSFYAADFARKEGALASRQADLEASQEEINGRIRATQITEDLVQTIGGQRVAFAASGSSPTSGTAARIQEQTARRAAEDREIERSSAEIARLQALIRGSTARRQAGLEAAGITAEGYAAKARGANAEAASYLGAGQQALKYGMDVAKRK